MYFAPIGACEDNASYSQRRSINKDRSTKKPFVANSIAFHAQRMMLISALYPTRKYATRLILHPDLLPVNFIDSRLQLRFHYPGLGDSPHA
jgi:hypothetical protein